MSGTSSRALGALALGLAMALVWGCASANPIVHTVRPGESVWTIAQRYGVSPQDLARANGLVRAQTIHSGLKLAIPQPGDQRALVTADPADAVPATASTVTVEPSAADAVRPAPATAGPLDPQRGAVRRMPSESRAAPQRAEAKPITAARPARALSSGPAPKVLVAAPWDVGPAPHSTSSEPALSAEKGQASPVTSQRRVRGADTAEAAVPHSSAHRAIDALTGTEPVAESAATDGAGRAAVRATDAGATPAPQEGLAVTARRTQPSLFSSSSRLFASSSKAKHGYGLMTALDFALKLVLVLILAYVCMLALKKFSQRRMAGSGKGGGLRVVDTIGLAPNRQLHIVTLGERAFLLGSTPESVSLISDISQAQEMAGLPGGPQREEADPAFAQRLKELMKVAPAGRKAQSGSGVGLRLAQAAQFIKARSNQMRPLGEIIDETLSC